jgi:Uma2 family endonuclease
MAVAVGKFTLAEYLVYDDGTGNRYELFDGELIGVGIGTGQHGGIAEFLTDQFKAAAQQAQQPWTAKDMRIGLRSPRGTRWDTCRIPDVVVLPIAQWQDMQTKEALIDLQDPPPLLVVEVVSSSTVSTDYRAKYSEYSVLEIPEYWIVDPLAEVITLCQLQSGRYNDREYRQNQALESGLFPSLALTASQVLACGGI